MRLRVLGVALAAAFAVAALPLSSATGSTVETKRYIVVFDATQAADGTYALGGSYALYHDYALSLVNAAGGTVTADLSKQIGVMIVDSPNALFDEAMNSYALVDVAAEDFVWKAFPSYEEAVTSGQLTVVNDDEPPCRPGSTGCPSPEPHADTFEALQWNMELIRAPQAHALPNGQSGVREVEVGILDSGIHAAHPDFVDTDGLNVDCTPPRAADYVPLGPGTTVGTTCNDNQFHGTHVAGIVAARANGIGVVGVAPNVTLIPVKVCDVEGYCYSSSTARGIVHAGEQKFEVINMSFFVDDDTFHESHEFKCSSDKVQQAFRRANERAIQYARNQGVVPVAALGNSNNDLAHPPEPYENDCEVVPAETQGVVGTMALGPSSEKAYYSSYGTGATDVAAPGGNSRNPRGEIPGPCGTQVLSTIPGAYGCFQGTSMASPHATGVAALIVSQFGRLGNDAGRPDVVMRPQDVESYLQGTAIDLYATDGTLKGYDGCFGNGRIDAVKAVLHDTSIVRQPVETPIVSGCPTFR
jgi:subtilisin family serine protease